MCVLWLSISQGVWRAELVPVGGQAGDHWSANTGPAWVIHCPTTIRASTCLAWWVTCELGNLWLIFLFKRCTITGSSGGYTPCAYGLWSHAGDGKRSSNRIISITENKRAPVFLTRHRYDAHIQIIPPITDAVSIVCPPWPKQPLTSAHRGICMKKRALLGVSDACCKHPAFRLLFFFPFFSIQWFYFSCDACCQRLKVNRHS